MKLLKFKEKQVNGSFLEYYVPTTQNKNDLFVLQSGTIANSDKLDNLDSTQFLRSDVADDVNGVLKFKANPIMENDGASFLGIDFNRTANGKYDYKIGIDASGNFIVQSNNNTSTFTDMFKVNYDSSNLFIGGSKIWHQNNDGSGSGLDADLLDGLHNTSFMRTDVATAARNIVSIDNTGTYGFFLKRLTTSSEQVRHYVDDSSYTMDYINDEYASNIVFKLTNTDTEGSDGSRSNVGNVTINQDKTQGTRLLVNNNLVWHQGNDGVGSGLDADMVDGIQSSRIVYGENNTGSTTVGNINTLTKSGFYRAGAGATGNPAANDAFYFINTVAAHSSDFGFQIGSMADTESGLYVRNKASGTSKPWARVYTTLYKPNKTDVGLSNLPNSKSDDYVSNSSDILATTKAVQKLKTDILGNVDGAFDTLKEIQDYITNNSDSIGNILTSLDTKVSKSGDTMTGALTIKKNGHNMLNLIGTDNHGYISYFTNSSSESTRTAWLGFGTNGTNEFSIHNEKSSSRIDLNSTGVNTTVDLKEKGQRVYSPNNKPTNVDLNLVSRAGDSISGKLNISRATTIGGSMPANLANAWFVVGTDTNGIGFDDNEIVRKGGYLIINTEEYLSNRINGTEISKVTSTGLYEHNSRVWTANTFNPSSKLNTTGGTLTGNLLINGSSQLQFNTANSSIITYESSRFKIKSASSIEINADSDNSSSAECVILKSGTVNAAEFYKTTSNIKNDFVAEKTSTMKENVVVEKNINVAGTADINIVKIGNVNMKYNTDTNSLSFTFI